MSKMAGDLVEVGVAKEATRGTYLPPTYGLRWGDLEFNDKTMMSLDESRSGILEDSRDNKVVGLYAEGSTTFPVRDASMGLFMLSLFGTVADSTVESGVYDHVFTVAQNVNHTSLSFHRKDPNGGYDYALGMIGSLEVTVETDKHVMASCDVRSKSRATQTIGTFTVTIAAPGVASLAAHNLVTGDAVIPTTTGALPTGLTAGTTYYVIKTGSGTFNFATTLANALSATAITTSGSQSGTHTLTLAFRYITYTATENVFLPQHASLKLASTQAGLDAAQAINVRSAKLTIKSEIEDDRVLGTTAPSDIVNKSFSIECEVVIVRNAETYITALLAGTAYALRLDMTNTDVTIGATSNPRLRFDLHQVILNAADSDVSKGDLTLQTLSFKATYKEADSKMVTATLRNIVASY